MDTIIDHEPDFEAGVSAAVGTELVLVRQAAPSILKADKEDEDLLNKLAAEIAAFKPDISTATGREAIKRMSRKVSSVKAALVKKAAAMKEDALRLQRAVNAEVKVLEERMDALRDRVKLELDEWEQQDRDRIAEHEARLAEMVSMQDTGGRDLSPAEIAQRLDRLTTIKARDWQEFRARATEAYTDSYDRLADLLTAAQRREREAAELAELRAAKAEQDRIKAHMDAIAQIAAFAVIEHGSGPDGAVLAMDAKVRLDVLSKPATRDWQEYAVQANETRAMAVQRLTALHAELTAKEAAAQAERDRKIAEEAAAEATRQAEQKAELEAAAAAVREANERRMREEAEQRAARAEQARKDAEAAREAQRLADMQADLDAMTALLNFDGQGSGPGGGVTSGDVAARIRSLGRFAGRDFGTLADEAAKRFQEATAALVAKKAQVEAAEQAARDEADRQTRDRERHRIETERAQQEAKDRAEREKREANKAHRGKINRTAADAMMVAASITEAQAQAIIVAIARGEIPHVTIAY